MDKTVIYQDQEFKEAISKIRRGDVDNGFSSLESMDEKNIFRNVAMAEVEYYRGNHKNAMYLDEHSLSSDGNWYDSLVVPHHLRAYVRAAKKIGAISRAKEFLDYYIANKRREYDVVGIRPFNKIYQNAMRRLDDIEAKDEPPEIRIMSHDEAECEFKFIVKNGPAEPSPDNAPGAAVMLNFMWNHAATDSVLEFYEDYAEYINVGDHHIWAARNYIKMGNHDEASRAIMRYVKTWEPREKFQVLPMRLFVFKDIIEYISGDLMTEIMRTPKIDTK
ncbi:MAG: hypothetical protein MJZ61_09490 [Bacteroidales bacterium]|nr:hypothetical protein [Bacteroidales bacterium]